MTTYYNVFHRTWWKRSQWSKRLEPGIGKRHYIKRHVTLGEALELCEKWNTSHEPGELDDKAEFEEV